MFVSSPCPVQGMRFGGCRKSFEAVLARVLPDRNAVGTSFKAIMVADAVFRLLMFVYEPR